MIKSISLTRRRAGMSGKASGKHYEKAHAPRARERFRPAEYVRNYVIVPPGVPEPDSDCITEFMAVPDFGNDTALDDCRAFSVLRQQVLLR